MNENSVDKFLLAHKVEVEDKGFSDRVMQSLPVNADLKRRMSRLWNTIFIVMLVVFCWQTDVLGILMVDIKAFLVTLPSDITDTTIWYTLGCLLIAMYGMIGILGKKLSTM